MGAMVGMAVADSVGAFLEFLPVGKKAITPCHELLSFAKPAGQGSRFNPKTLQAGKCCFSDWLQ